MHLLIGKRQLILASLVVILGLAVFVNWYYTNTNELMTPEGSAVQGEQESKAPDSAAELVNAEADTDMFSAARLKRTQTRDSSIADLQAVMASAEQDSDTLVLAAAAIEGLSTTSKQETDIESLVTAALGGDCVAVISQSGVEIIVESGILNESNVLQITDIVTGVCPNGCENLKISAAG